MNFISQDSTICIWKDLNNCFSKDTIVNGGTTGYSFIKVYNCDCSVTFDHYVTSDGGHSWPGGNPNNNPVSYQISATYLLWEFFKNYTLGYTTGVNDHQNTQQGHAVYPNPVREKLIISNLNTEVEYSVISIPGDLVCSGTTKSIIDLQALRPGVYILHLTKDCSRSTFKIVKE